MDSHSLGPTVADWLSLRQGDLVDPRHWVWYLSFTPFFLALGHGWLIILRICERGLC